MIRVVTIAREFGSGGAFIAAELARRLDWKLLDAQLIREVASRAGIEPDFAEELDERLDPPIYRILKSVWRGGSSRAVAAREIPFDSETMARLTATIINHAAELGECVIVGRGGQCVLQHRTDVLHVFVYAPWEQRVRRVKVRSPGESSTEELILRRDDQRASWIRSNFGCDWSDRYLYHLLLSSSLGEETAVRCLLETVRSARETNLG